MNKEKIIKAGKIASQVRKYIKQLIKPNMPLLEIAEKIETKILELGGKLAFPVNLSINEIAAHYTPSYNDKTLAHGLLKIDFGVHIDGWAADVAFSIDLENSKENKTLILASEEALKKALEISKENKEKTEISEIGKSIQKAIESHGFSPIVNLSGHEIKKYELHSGRIIPNIDNKNDDVLKKGLYAIEPFATPGSGKVIEGKPSEIYILLSNKNVRSQTAREILKFIEEEYQTLPFCSRWLVKKFGIKSIFALKQLKDNKNIHNFPELIEASKSKVSQSEDTIFIDDKGEIIITTK